MSVILKICTSNIKTVNNLRLTGPVLQPKTISSRYYGQIRNSTAAQPSILKVNTNVVKDVILFCYENPRQFKLLNIFAIVQFAFWSYLSVTVHSTLVDIPVKGDPEKLPWWRKVNLGEKKYRYGITYMCFGIGYGVIFCAWMYTLRSVRYLILRKGGKAISFVTYTPFGQNRIMDVPLEKISAKQSRSLAKVHFPIKVKNKMFHYILDMRGEFRNARLFDATAGLKRNLDIAK